MARRLLIALAAALLATPAYADLACTGGTDAAGDLAQARLLPLAQLLARHLGPATQCTIVDDDAGHTLTLHYPQGGTLAATSNETLESASQLAALPAAAALTQHDAVAALRANEIQQTGAHGCGIAWSPLLSPMPATADRTATGRSCSCKARLHTESHAVTTLGFSTAC